MSPYHANQPRFKLDQASAVLQLMVGRTCGKVEILRQYALLKTLFVDRMENIIRQWMDIFFPYRTGTYHDAVLNSMVIEWKRVSASASMVPYARYVEMMVGVLWTNAMTVEQSMARLKDFVMAEMVQILKDLKEEVGL